MLLGTPESLPDQPGPLRILSKEVGLCSNVANAKRCHILSTAAHSPSCSDCSQLMTLLANDWRHITAHRCTWQQQNQHRTTLINRATAPDWDQYI